MTDFRNADIDVLRHFVKKSEDSTTQFKSEIPNAETLAAEMAAFANSEGGIILIGVNENGAMPEISPKDIAEINTLISNAAIHKVSDSLGVSTGNVVPDSGRVVILLTVPKGIDKPYFDKNGVIWLKAGADKRRVNSKEELRRLFQMTNQFHADELPTRAGIDKLDKLRFRDFLRDMYKQEYPEVPAELTRLLQNMNLAAEDGKLNLAAVLLFAEQSRFIVPRFPVRGIHYPGNEIHSADYLDTKDFAGSLRKVFYDTLAFVMRNLHKVQTGRGANAPGRPKVSEMVFEELLVNALVHRDYLISAPIRLFIFDNRIEIISPGHLPDNLTVEKIRTGNSNIRNPILLSYIAKGLLPYHGPDSGIRRALNIGQKLTSLMTMTEVCSLQRLTEKQLMDCISLPISLIKQLRKREKYRKSVGEASEKRRKRFWMPAKKIQPLLLRSWLQQ